MSDVWKAEVSISAVTYTGLTTGVLAGDSNRYAYGFTSIDGNGSSLFFPAIRLKLEEDGSGNYRTKEEHGLATHGDAITVFFPHAGGTFTAAGTGAFTAGGTLSVTKDEGSSMFTWTGPLGSSSQSFAAMPGTAVAGELGPDSIGLRGGASVNTGGTFSAATLDVSWANFFGSQNATHIKGADLGSTDRGSWLSTLDVLSPWNFVRSGNVTVNTPDTATALVAHILGNTASGLLGPGSATGTRVWDQSVYITGMSPASRVLDLTHVREHGSLFAALAYSVMPADLKLRQSHDGGANWSESTILTAGGDVLSPSINWHETRLYVAFGVGSTVYLVNSYDYGTTWSSPVALSIIGTNPRHVIDRDHGLSYFFYIDATDLKVVGSGDFGETVGSPTTVAAGIGAQTIGAAITSDGAIVVEYVLSGTVTQKKSRDLGQTWS